MTTGDREAAPLHAGQSTRPEPPRRWTWSDSWRLEGRAYFWLVLVTTPAVTLLVFGGSGLVTLVGGPAWQTTDLWSLLSIGGFALLWALGMMVVVAVAALGGILVALPFTHLVGVRLRSDRPAWVHVAATALVAGTLGALTTLFWLGPLVAVPLSLATGAAGAIARSEEFRAPRPDQTPRPSSDSTSSRSS